MLLSSMELWFLDYLWFSEISEFLSSFEFINIDSWVLLFSSVLDLLSGQIYKEGAVKQEEKSKTSEEVHGYSEEGHAKG